MCDVAKMAIYFYFLTFRGYGSMMCLLLELALLEGYTGMYVSLKGCDAPVLRFIAAVDRCLGITYQQMKILDEMMENMFGKGTEMNQGFEVYQQMEKTLES